MKLPRIYEGLDREGVYLEGLRRASATVNDMVDHHHRHFAILTERYQMANASPLGLNLLLFRKAIELQGTPEQQKYWLPLIDGAKVNGAYAQTEVGHGTFVRGIETTATFDHDTDEFILHSPSLTSTKFWPGGLGLSCSHAIVVARLMIGKPPVDHGIHMFLVQVRSIEDFKPVDGVELGDQGMKMSYNGTCNGYARFNNLRIPRNSLLSAHAQVTKNGSFVRGNIDKARLLKKTYSTMLHHRGLIPRCVSFALAQSVTITARYSVVRLQGHGIYGDDNQEEKAILEFKSQHYRILTLISQAYAILFASKRFDFQYDALQQSESGDGTSARLPFIHALASGLKAWSSTVACAGVEEARQMCGGHGYVALSGLPEILSAVSASLTFEGENYVLWQQLGKYLLGQLQAFSNGNPIAPEMGGFLTGIEKYLRDEKFDVEFKDARRDQLLDASTLLSIFLHRSRRLLVTAYRQFERNVQRLHPAQAWNRVMMPIISAGRAFIEYLVLQYYKDYIDAISTAETSLSPVLTRLYSLFALTTIINPNSQFTSASFTEDGTLSLSHIHEMSAQIDEILIALLPDVISLTDAWDFTDASLCSALGCRDGNVYERLMSWTRQIPLNSTVKESDGVLSSMWGGPYGMEGIIKRDMKNGARL
ncbi:Acyl-coenzyme A oxidase [Penicillium sp. IBT 35674x]|nr:Acyl-coenzyme A oxidase [Penicillium sp. IBT 35674x]